MDRSVQVWGRHLKGAFGLVGLKRMGLGGVLDVPHEHVAPLPVEGHVEARVVGGDPCGRGAPAWGWGQRGWVRAGGWRLP